MKNGRVKGVQMWMGDFSFGEDKEAGNQSQRSVMEVKRSTCVNGFLSEKGEIEMKNEKGKENESK